MSQILASVAVPRPVRRLFTYVVPEHLLARCRRGVRVLVPFGRRRLTGYLLEVAESAGKPAPPILLRPLEAVLDPDPVLDEPILELTRWAADYYVVSWGEMIRAALPGMRAQVHALVSLTPAGRRALEAGEAALVDASMPAAARGRPEREILGFVADLSAKAGRVVRLADLKRRLGPRFRAAALSRLRSAGLLEMAEVATGPGPHPRLEPVASLSGVETPLPRGPRQREILRHLEEAGGALRVRELLRISRATRGALRTLETRGAIRVRAVESPRRPFLIEGPEEATTLQPTPDQQVAIDAIAALGASGRYATALLHGVTGSGKTEVYLRSIEKVIASGKRALYLVPEIGLTPLLARRMRSRFGDTLALMHSGLSAGERYDEWRRIRERKVNLVLGARSAVFAPLPDLGIIVVDEEHDASYKQDEYPRYNGRDLAILRGRMTNALVLLGSATPSMESFHQAERGRYHLLTLPRRIGSAGLPAIERVDMRREFEEAGRESILSRRLLQALRERLGRGEQSLILLNRRGFSTFVLCRVCGEQIGCRRCSIAMTLHLKDQRLRCHYCNDSRKVPSVCPACGSGHLHFGGTGTERLEERLRAECPGARIERMDRDAVRGRGAVEGILTRVERGEIDILVGTQMIAKGHDFPNVTLVGVLAADALLGLPDFRSSERTFQLLSQVAGRSGRAERGGEVIVQAFDAGHHAIRSACEHDFDGFAAKELSFRRVMSYPPYSALALVLVKDRHFDRARAGAGLVAEALRAPGTKGLQVLGPAPAPLERLRGEYRVQVLLKAASRRTMRDALAALLEDLDRKRVRVDDLVIDVDPLSTT